MTIKTAADYPCKEGLVTTRPVINMRFDLMAGADLRLVGCIHVLGGV